MLIKFSNQTEIKITEQDLLTFYTVLKSKDRLGLTVVYENSLDNIKQEKVEFQSGETKIVAEISKLMVSNHNGYEGFAACLELYDYFAINKDQHHLYRCNSVVEIVS